MATDRRQQEPPQQQHRQPFAGEKVLMAGVSNGLAGLCTNPIDVVKVRLQTQGALLAQQAAAAAAAAKAAAAGPSSPAASAAAGPSAAGPAAAAAAAVGIKRQGALAVLHGIARDEGARGLMAGWQASVMRELTYSGLRMGLYDEVRALLIAGNPDEGRFTTPQWKKIVAGGVSGCIGAALANPTDLVKVRAQALNPATGEPFYPIARDAPLRAFAHIARTEGGWRALYRGVGPTVQRAAILTAAQLSTYDTAKNDVLVGRLGLQEGALVHFLASLVAGFAVATATNPVDICKSRVMALPPGELATAGGTLGILRRAVRDEGLFRALFAGWLPNFARIAPHTMCSLLVFEAIRKAAGLDAV